MGSIVSAVVCDVSGISLWYLSNLWNLCGISVVSQQWSVVSWQWSLWCLCCGLCGLFGVSVVTLVFQCLFDISVVSVTFLWCFSEILVVSLWFLASLKCLCGIYVASL